MMQQYQVHRNSLAWMLAAQAAVILPHVARLPVWITMICVGCFVWRVMVYQGRWSYPGRWVKFAFVVGGIVSLVAGYGTMLGVDPWVGLLVLMFVLKLLETHDKRDAFVVILLGYFVALTQFLYFQDILWTLYMFLCVAMVTAALIGLNQTRSHVRPVYTFRRALVLLLQSLPLMLVLFVLFPRLSPLWSVPLQEGAGRTGVTDVMRPGDIAELTQSDELAFRVTFKGEAPLGSQLYWRGLVLSYFDAEIESWTQERPGVYGVSQRKGRPDPEWMKALEYRGNPVDYSVILEPTNQNWMFSLSLPEPSNLTDVALIRDYRFYSFRTIRGKLRYELRSYLDYRTDTSLSDFWRYRYTLLPADVNPQTRQLASDLLTRSQGHEAYIGEVLRMFNQQAFTYTLNPPMLGASGIDEFLFETRRGFCEHYAGSFVFLMRAAGIPARVVVGYQGGEYNRIGNYVEVRQYDAHAWAEVWLPGTGWRRVDPTSAVAPERIERGLADVMQEEDSFLADVPLSWMKARSLWLIELRLQMSALSHYWDTFVVGYTPTMQEGLLQRLFNRTDRAFIGGVMLALFFGLLLLVGVFLLAKRSVARLSPVDEAFLRFCSMLAKQGLERRTGEAPRSFLRRVQTRRPDLGPAVRTVVDCYEKAIYVDDNPQAAADLNTAIRAYRLRALGANA